MRWPDAIHLRRAILPTLEALEDDGIVPRAKYSFRIHDNEFAGVWRGVDTREARERLRGMDDFYPRNLAACKFYVRNADEDAEGDGGSSPKYRENKNGQRVYEHGSYAYTPGGLLGRLQVHVRLLPHDDGTAVFAHHEYNPLAAPVKHYRGDTWDAERGKKKACELLDLDADASLDGIIFPSDGQKVSLDAHGGDGYAGTAPGDALDINSTADDIMSTSNTPRTKTRHRKTKKALLTAASVLVPSGLTLIQSGDGDQMYVGLAMTAVGIGAVLGYDFLDDRAKTSQ